MRNLNVRVWGLLLTLLILPGITSMLPAAAVDTCPNIVQNALDFTNEQCQGTMRNQACYGHEWINADFKPDAEAGIFDHVGDTASLVDMRSLRLSPMDLQNEYWGVALMRLQANLADEPATQNVTLLAFGDVQVQNAAEDATLLEAKVSAESNALVRNRPALDGYIIGAVESGQTVTATGRLEDLSWLRVILPDGETGWVHSSLLSPAGESEFMALDVVEGGTAYYRPLQAFYFQSGVDDAACAQAPESGLLIQTPEGVGEIRLLVNEVSVVLGSTAFLQAGPGKGLIVHLLEGSGWVQAQGVKQPLYPGTQVTVPLGEDLSPAGPPVFPKPYDMESLRALPVSTLDRDIEVSPSMSQATLNALLEAWLSAEEEDPATGQTVETGPAETSPSGIDAASGGGADYEGDGGGEGEGEEGQGDHEWDPPGLEGKNPKGLEDKGGKPPGQQ